MQPIETDRGNRILVVDDDALLIGEYLNSLGDDFEPDLVTQTLGDLEKVLFGETVEERPSIRFQVDACRQGEEAVAAVEAAIADERPYAIVFIDIRMPPGIDGLEAARRMRALDDDVNIVVVTGSVSPEPEDLGGAIPPADKIFFFKKPFHAVECRQLAAALCGKWHADRALRRANEDLERRVVERTEALTKLAYVDTVTRLPNQLLLVEELKAQIDRAEDGDGDTAVVLLDIERFSFINETMGFDAGTELLRSVGNRLSRHFCDARVASNAIVGRFGSDEFAVLMPGIDADNDIEDLANEVRRVVEEPFLIAGRDLYLKTAIGVAWYPVHGRDAKSVIRCAESALHRSINSIDKAVTFYHSEMRYRAKHRFELEAELRRAIEAGHIDTLYQPQQCTHSGALAGVEALARWARPDGPTALPSEFVPLSEEMGISDVLFEAIMRKVCRDIVAWRETRDWQTPVSINLSAHQLRNRDLVALVCGILDEEGIEHGLIKLELTETVLLEDVDTARRVLHGLAETGIGIHIDDFGTGYSSLSYLAQLPVETLKIDQVFTAKLTDEQDANRRVVEAIVALGKALRLEVVAEGVETDRQYAVVRRLGVDLAQGFFIARPMPAAQLPAWLDGHVDTQSIKKQSRIADLDPARRQ